MHINELRRRAGVAIRLAFDDDERGFNQLIGYVSEIDTMALQDLGQAAKNLGDAIDTVLGGHA